eukprot:5016238-Ditylum_brightwellii.AAC.1
MGWDGAGSGGAGARGTGGIVDPCGCHGLQEGGNREGEVLGADAGQGEGIRSRAGARVGAGDGKGAEYWWLA